MRYTKILNVKSITSVLIFIAAAAFIMSSCTASGTKPIEALDEADISANEKLCFDFLEREMINADGGIRTNWLEGEKTTELATGGQVLSESIGLMMLYAVQTGNEQLFESSYEYAKNRLDTGEIFAYRYDDGGQEYHVNAFVDDIRIIDALLTAGDVFGGRYISDALDYAQRLYGTNVKDGRIYDMYDDSYDVTNGFITLCYIDLDTVKRLGEYEEKWTDVYDTMLGIAVKGYISYEFPMFAGRYDYETGTYSEDDVNMVEALLTALNLAKAGKCPGRTLEFLKSELESGVLYAHYKQDGKKASNMESTAVYAICALIAGEAGDREMYMLSMEKMESFQVMDKNSQVYGAFADPKTLELFSFDNLMALLAMRQAGEYA